MSRLGEKPVTCTSVRVRDEGGSSCGVARLYACALLRPYIISRRYKCPYVCKIPSSGRVEP